MEIRSVPASGYTRPVSSRHPRIQVPRDPALDRAIAAGRSHVPPGTPTSQVVRELALRGATALAEEAAAESRGRDFLVAVADGASGLDLDGLRTVRDEAWR